MASTTETNNKYAVYLAIGKILAMIAQFIMPLFLTRYLTKSDYGIYCQYYLWLTFLGNILNMGIQSNLYFFYPNTTHEERGTVVWNTLLLQVIIGGSALIIFAIPGFVELILGDGDILRFAPYIVLGVFVFIPSTLITPLATVRKDKMVNMFYPITDIMLKTALVIVFALVFRTLSAIIWAIILLQVIQFVFVVGYVGINYHFSLDKTNVIAAKKQLAYSLPFGVAIILQQVCSRFDKIICTSTLSTEEYAIYALAFFGIPGIMQVYDSICQVNVINMAVAYKQGESTKVLDLYRKFIRQTLSFSVPVIMIVFLFAPQIIATFFSEKYIESVPFFRIYILTFIVGMLGCGTILRAVNKTRLSMWAFLVATIICVPVTYFLVKQYGIWGGIVSATFNTIAPKLIQIAIEMYIMKISVCDYLPWRDIAKILAIAVAIFIPFAVINHLYGLSFLLCTVLGAIYVVITYYVMIRVNVFMVSKKYFVQASNKFLSKIFRSHSVR